MKIVKAAESIVSCTGSDCDLCHLLETVSNIYNFVLGIVFAVAVLFLIVSGFQILMSGGKRDLVKQAKSRLKVTLIGFGFILLGWLAIHTLFLSTGYTNAGSWWEFKCREAETIAVTDQSTYYPEDYDVSEYSSLSQFLTSQDAKGKISGPSNIFTLNQQLASLEEGSLLQFLAPVSLNGIEEFLPLISLKKEGGKIKAESIGEYWNVIQNEWPSVSSQAQPLEKEIIDRYISTSPSYQQYSLPENSNSILSLFGEIADVAQVYEKEGEGTDKPLSLDELLLLTFTVLLQENKNEEETSNMLASLLAEIMKYAGGVVVEKEDPKISLEERICERSGGDWINSECICPPETRLQGNGKCYLKESLKRSCERSNGKWIEVDNSFQPTPICDNENSQGVRAGLNEVINYGEYYCSCPKNNCISFSGTCYDKNSDNDDDGIINEEDKCPDTPEREKGEINNDKESENYGCSCSEIEITEKECYKDKCVDDYLYSYPSGEQECRNGELIPYNCNPDIKYDRECAKENEEESEEDSEDSKGPSENQGTGEPIIDDFSKDTKGVNLGQNQADLNQRALSIGNPEGVKASLRRLHERDPLRYEMVFRFGYELRSTGGGGVCWGCGHFAVNHGLPLKEMDVTITHEATHSAHFCVKGRGGYSLAEAERIAVGNEIGSMERNGPKDMKEFVGQSKEISYKGQEVRGYQSRWMVDVNPKGDQDAGNMTFGIRYALYYGDATKGPYHYGYPEKKQLLGLKNKEEDVIASIMDRIVKCRDQKFKDANKRLCTCFSKPPSDLPPVEACNDATRVMKF